MAGKIINRCMMREVPGDGSSAQCLRAAGHPANQCQFQDGQAALDAADKASMLRIETGAGVAALGLVVLRMDDALAGPQSMNAEAMKLTRESNVVIGYDGVNVTVIKSRLPIQSGGGIEAVVDAAKTVNAIVTFGVGLIRIESGADYHARTQSGA